jgi:hypothetical protein
MQLYQKLLKKWFQVQTIPRSQFLGAVEMSSIVGVMKRT